MKNEHFSNQGWTKRFSLAQLMPITSAGKVTAKVPAKVTASAATPIHEQDTASKNLAQLIDPQPQPNMPTALVPKDSDVTDSEGGIIHRRPNGRPTKYREEYAQMMFDFFNIRVEKVVITELPDGKVKSEVVINTFPTFGRFASKIGVSRDTLHSWATAKNKDGTLRRPGFSDTYTRARDFQESLLIEGGMSGAYDGRFVCLLAQCILGWSHKPKQKPESASNGAMSAELERVYVDALKVAMEKATVRPRNKAKLK